MAELESGEKDKKTDQFRDIVLTLAFTAGPFGFGVPILYSCISWAVAWIAFVHLIWKLEHLSTTVNWRKSVVAFIASVGLVIVTYEPIRAAYIKEKARTTSGDLIAKSDGKDHSAEPPKYRIGPNGGATFVWSGQDSSMFTMYMDKIKIIRRNGKLLFSTTVRDDNGNLVADIDDNHWRTYYISSDHNYTDDSLEVKDAKGRVVLQVRLLPDVVELQQETGGRALTGPSGVTIPAGGLFQIGKHSDIDGIVPLFRYPSDLYWGKYVVPSPY